MTIPKQDERTPGRFWVENRDGRWQVQTAHRGPGSSFCVAQINHWADDARALAEQIVKSLNAYGSTDALRSALERFVWAAHRVSQLKFDRYKKRNGHSAGIEADDGEKCWIVHSDEIALLEGALEKAHAALSGSPAPSTEGLREALALYEQAVVHAEAVLGGEYADFDGPFYDIVCKARDAARTALAGVTAPSEVDG